MKPFPAHWGPPPRIQTRDFRPLPGGYGRGSSTLARWIQTNLDRDAKAAKVPANERFLYTAVLSGDTVPNDLFILDGRFSIRKTDAGNVLELDPTPLRNFGVLFGPNRSTNIVARARVRAESAGRRHSVFAVGLGGVSGYRLRVAPGKARIELTRQDEVLASSSFTPPKNAWVAIELRTRSADGKWRIEGRAWADGGAEPENWPLHHVTPEAPPHGRASIWGEPFAGKPIQFDQLSVCEPGP